METTQKHRANIVGIPVVLYHQLVMSKHELVKLTRSQIRTAMLMNTWLFGVPRETPAHRKDGFYITSTVRKQTIGWKTWS